MKKIYLIALLTPIFLMETYVLASASTISELEAGELNRIMGKSYSAEDWDKVKRLDLGKIPE